MPSIVHGFVVTAISLPNYFIFQVILGLPPLLLPWGFQSKAWWLMLTGLLKVWPSQPNFLFFMVWPFALWTNSSFFYYVWPLYVENYLVTLIDIYLQFVCKCSCDFPCLAAIQKHWLYIWGIYFKNNICPKKKLLDNCKKPFSLLLLSIKFNQICCTNER